MKKRALIIAVTSCVVLGLAACGDGAGNGAAASGATASTTPLKVGFLADLTGAAASSFDGGLEAAKARIEQANASGGVNGRKIELVSADTASSPAQALVAAQHLVENEKVFGIITESAFVFGASKYLQRQNVPVTGWGIDGPEWIQQPNTNMFSAYEPVLGQLDGKNYRATYDGVMLKQQGVTKLATLAFEGSPSSVAQVAGTLAGAEQEGITSCYQNYAVPVGGSDFTAIALQIKQAGCDGLRTSFVESSDLALIQTLHDAGVSLKVALVGIYGQAILDPGAANQSAQGAFADNQVNFTQPGVGTLAMIDTLAKYDPTFKKGSVPSYGHWTGWVGADLMITGLQKAGPDPTAASFIENMRKVSGYDAGGMLATAVGFGDFGTAKMLPPTPCQYYFQVQGAQFKALNNGQKICGKYIPVGS
ncbi:ABC transporter substrate-binding protein [Pseudonocardia sp. GCM10023141]|uniref:ABC transporter substrate-binding protein n=1 Tax=Pseudonocardia sp. GCM10023141 TaxID=3252653 RepID=UPI003615AB91